MPPQSVGYLYALAAFTIFAAQDGISKHLGSAYPPVFVAMVRYWAFAIFVIILAMRSQGGIRQAASTRRFFLQAGRGALLAVRCDIVASSAGPVSAFPHVGVLVHTNGAVTPDS